MILIAICLNSAGLVLNGLVAGIHFGAGRYALFALHATCALISALCLGQVLAL